MSQREIEVVIEPDGTVTIEALNYKGKGCHEDLTRIAARMGRVINSNRKPEFYDRKVTVGNRNQTRG
jgi:hypothetical protein